MAERILKSPGISTRELDLSAPGKVSPQGIPAGIIGTAEKGPAFVPTNFATLNEFTSLFGGSMGVHYGAMAMKEWMRNARSGVFLRTLGVGNAQAADASSGVTENAGFIVGDEIVDYTNTSASSQGLESEGSVWVPSANPFAGDGADIDPDTITVSNPIVGSDEIAAVSEITSISFGNGDGINDNITPSDWNGVVILIAEDNSGTTAFYFDNNGDATVDGLTVTDGQLTPSTYWDGTSVTGLLNIQIVDISSATTEQDLYNAFAAQIGGANNTLAIESENTIDVISIQAQAGAVYASSTIQENPNIVSLSVSSSQTGEDLVPAVSAEWTITVDDLQILDGTLITVTKVDGSPFVFEFTSTGEIANTSDWAIDISSAATVNEAATIIQGEIQAAIIDQGISLQSATVLNSVVTLVTVVPDTNNGESWPTVDEWEPSTTSTVPGTTYFLAVNMTTSDNTEDYLGISTGASSKVLRGVLMVANGIVPALQQSGETLSSVPTVAYGEFGAGKDVGGATGELQSTDDRFVIALNGFDNSNYSSLLTASFDPTSPVYFPKVLNTDPNKLQERGHFLYAHYDIPGGLAVATGEGTNAVYLTKSQHAASGLAKDNFSKTNFDNWQQKFTHAATPWITSQVLGDTAKKLFRFHALDAGASGAGKFKVSISSINKSAEMSNPYGTFDVLIRSASDSDDKPVVLQQFRGVNLNPGSDRYIARLIGDQHVFFDFEKPVGKQKLVMEGLYPNQSPFVRIEVDESIEDGTMNPSALPVGFQGKNFLQLDAEDLEEALVEAPLPLRNNVSIGSGNTKVVDSRFFWGVQIQDIREVSLKNKETTVISLVNELTKHFTTTGGTNAAWQGDSTTADAYNNNAFTLENILIATKTDNDGAVNTENPVDPNKWHEAVYIRNKAGYDLSDATLVSSGVLESVETGAGGDNKLKSSANGYRFLDVSKDFGQSASKKFIKFTVPFQGGWDGLDIFDKEKAKMSNVSSVREMDTLGSSYFGGPDGATTAAFRKSIDILAEKTDVDVQLLATPGMRSNGITDYAIDKTEERFDALYILDTMSYDHEGYYVTASSQEVSVSNTAQALANRNLDTSFAAAYFPDVVLKDGDTAVVVPPSVPVLGALALNDAIAHPWYAPAGFARGALPTTIETAVKLNRANMDVLYEADINPITSFPLTGESVVIFGQKTLLQAQSALDRVNVRRLLIDVRRKVKQVSNSILFEPNRDSTLSKFSAMVNPILQRIQSQNGLEKFKVIIDTTTTTQEDIENNTIRGKIFLQPTKSIEFISLDFVVGNQGMDV